ncbi:MAG TPA: hypothetical protein VNU26_09445, partial [Mycobacteriales bacterium]|nr:hypothetical protein [Mycobacteriales bacterium]
MSTVEPGPDLTRRIEELASYAADEGDAPAVSMLVSAVRAEIGAVRAELGSLRSEVGAVRTDLDGLGGRLTGSVAASRSETGTLVRRVAELAARVDGVGGRVDDVRNGLPGLSREMRETLTSVPQRTDLEDAIAGLRGSVEQRLDDVGERVHRSVTAALEQEAQAAASTQASLVDTRGALESRLAVLEDALDAMSERLESLARDGATTTTDRLERLSGEVTSLERRVEDQGRDAAELLVGRLRDVVDTRMSEMETALYDRLSMILRARTEELRDDVVGALERTSAESTSSREAVSELAETVRRALDGFGEVLDRSLTGLGGSVSTALSEGREASRADLTELADRLGGTVAELRDDLRRRAEQDRTVFADLRAAVEQRLEAVRGQVAAALADARTDVATEVGTLRPQLAELTASANASSEGFAALRVDLAESSETLRERLTAVTTESAAAVRDALAETRTEVAERTRALREEVLERVEQVFGTVVDRLGDLAADVTAGTGATRAATERLAVLAAASDTVRRTLEEVRTDVGRSTEDLRAALVAQAEQQLATVTERLAEVARAVESSAGDTRTLQQRAEALAEAAEAFRDEVNGRLELVRDDVVEAGRDLRKELFTKADAQAAELLDRLAALDTTVDESGRDVGERLTAVDTALQANTGVTEQASLDVRALVETTDALGGIVGGFRKEWPTRSLEVVQGAKAAAEATLGEVRGEVAAKLDEVTAALDRALGGVDRARSGIDTGTKRLSAAGQVLLQYLEERDRLLEAERDRVLHEILDEFASGLSARDRAALRSRMGDAVSRRRDARDAERYRAAVGEPRPPVTELPEDVSALVPPPPPPPPPPPVQPGLAAPPAPGRNARLGGALEELSRADDALPDAEDDVPTGRGGAGRTADRHEAPAPAAAATTAGTATAGKKTTTNTAASTTTAKKAPAKKTTAKKTTAKKTTAKKTTARMTTAKKATAKQPARKTAA